MKPAEAQADEAAPDDCASVEELLAIAGRAFAITKGTLPDPADLLYDDDGLPC